ncbi:DUF4124 domain-containing protein [Rehaibacterium terrae]|jgi:hypothetical protein|uniref:DUF4124 domain-containing protein n=1 Tax=Rehaibacterium terrae TaxID=1341696 RepID=A0A7W7Y166_9GAMM|nr:DUF4124 domain-containing protein [Rehaibacterium terrae]MBB5016192.1 hypothetical protein [Rehaibacterium terrae]
MRASRLALAIALGFALATPAAQAQKLYRWVDKDGKVHYSDALPPEAVDQARRELSAKSGLTVGEVDRALTDEERAALAAAAAEAQSAAEREALQRERDRVLMASFPNEADLSRAYGERIKLLEEALKATQATIDGQHQSLASLLANAADRELTGQPIDARTATSVRETQRQISLQQNLLQRREAERAALQLEYETTLARYRQLRDGG